MGGPSSPTERLTTRRPSTLDRITVFLARLSLGQLVFLCVVLTFFLKITAGSDRSSIGPGGAPFGGVAPVELEQQDTPVVEDPIGGELLEEEPKQLSFTELLETLPEHELENG